MEDPRDIGLCSRCGRWQRRRHAYTEEFGNGDREEWCVTGNCNATWRDGVALVLAAQHDPVAERCCCAACRLGDGAEPPNAVVETAADRGLSKPGVRLRT